MNDDNGKMRVYKSMVLHWFYNDWRAVHVRRRSLGWFREGTLSAAVTKDLMGFL